MSVKSCQINNEKGYKWGDAGKCYAYDPSSEESKNNAKKKAIAQGVAGGDLEAVGAQLNILKENYKFEKEKKKKRYSNFPPANIEFASYTDYPEAAKENAKIALRWAEENGWGECGTPVGKARANQLANGEPISEDTISRMAAFERHRQNSDRELGEGCGRLMWLAWGGDEGIAWAKRKLEQIKSNR
jgi:hypothetical protein